MTPVAKVTAAGLGGAVATLIVWVLTAAGLDVPGVVGTAFGTVCAFAAGYLKSP